MCPIKIQYNQWFNVACGKGRKFLPGNISRTHTLLTLFLSYTDLGLILVKSILTMAKHGREPGASALSTTAVTAARVHTPGKYIIVFGILPLCIIASLVAGLMLAGPGYKTPFAFEFRENGVGERTAYYLLPEILVDLSPDPQGQRHYLKARVALAVSTASSDENQRFDELRPVLAERATLFLRALRIDDFDGTEKMQRVKQAIAMRMNTVLGEELVDDVVLQNLIIQ